MHHQFISFLKRVLELGAGERGEVTVIRDFRSRVSFENFSSTGLHSKTYFYSLHVPIVFGIGTVINTQHVK